jgi:streptomycin 6-kinase
MIDVPAVVRNKARAAGAGDWLERLPALVSSLEAGWSITVGHPYEGTEAFVADATLADGTHPSAETGCPVLYRHDPGDGALLMERLGRPMHELGLPLARRLEILCAAAERIWRPAPDCGLPTDADKARWLADFILTSWQELDRPCPEKTVDHALACAVRRAQAHRDERAVLVHGDMHPLNALQNDGGFTLIDPDGLLAEAEYDLGVLMRGDPVELLGGDPADRAAGWPPARGSISSPCGSGALSSGCRQDCPVPASTYSPSAATRWRRPRPSPTCVTHSFVALADARQGL